MGVFIFALGGELGFAVADGLDAVRSDAGSEDLFLWTGLMILCAGVLAVMLVAIPYLKRRK